MKIILSNYLVNFLDLIQYVISGDCQTNIRENWRCDDIGNGYIIATNEFSLYTKIIKYEFMMDIPDIIRNILYIKIDNDPIALRPYQYQNKRVIGSMNDIKRLIQNRDFENGKINTIEQFVNNAFFKYINMKRPIELHKH